MKKKINLDPEKWRHFSKDERKKFIKSLDNTFGKVGRPLKNVNEKHIATYIKLHPKILKWAKSEAKKKGIGYQTVINNRLLKIAA